MILGLDVSTSCTGIAIVDDDGTPIVVGAVTTTHVDNLADKADAVLHAICDATADIQITAAFVEESLQAFRPGLSSANTICSLSKMNGLVSYLTQRAFGVHVSAIPSQTARKVCGIKLQRGEPAKQQVTRWALSNVLSGWDIPQKRRSQEPMEQVKDATDALIIAIAGQRMIRAQDGALRSDREPGDDDLDAHSVPATSVRQDHCVRVWKGSVRPVSVRVLPITCGEAQA